MLSAADKAGSILIENMGKISVFKKGRIDLVTEADKLSEEAVKKTILNQFPDHTIIAEESGSHYGDSPYSWIIDPLDGTTNYAHGLPLFAVSIAVAYKEEIIAGLVLNPVTKELFFAEKGCGATLNGKKIGVSQTSSISDALLVTGFSYELREIFEELKVRFSNCLYEARGIRRFGSAAMDLCYVACGRFDGFWEQKLKPWDTAAGFIIALESGGTATDFTGNIFHPELDEILVTNGQIHKEMLELLHKNTGI